MLQVTNLLCGMRRSIMLDEFLNAIGLSPELGFGALDLFVFAIALGLAFWIHFSTDTHGYITPGYRMSFSELPRFAKGKIYFSMLWSAGAVALLLYRVS